MTLNWTVVGSVGCAVSIAMGAFGAHGLRARLDVEALALWETAARYLMYGSLGLLTIGVHGRQTGSAAGWPAVLLAVGAVVFCVTVALLALGGPRWLGAVTPIGGTLMIAGFLAFAWAALSS